MDWLERLFSVATWGLMFSLAGSVGLSAGVGVNFLGRGEVWQGCLALTPAGFLAFWVIILVAYNLPRRKGKK